LHYWVDLDFCVIKTKENLHIDKLEIFVSDTIDWKLNQGFLKSGEAFNLGS